MYAHILLHDCTNTSEVTLSDMIEIDWPALNHNQI